MKVFLFLTFWSFSLLIQLSNGNGAITFSKVLDKFCGKAAQKNFLMRPKLEYLFKITDDKNINTLKAKFGAVVNGFVDTSKRDQILEKVPKDMHIGGFNTHDFFEEGINSIINGQTETFKTLNAKILSQIKSESITDADFINFYLKWEKNSIIDPKLALRVQDNVLTMQSGYKTLHDQFDEQIINLNILSKMIEKEIGAAVSRFDILLKSTSSDEKNIKELEQILVKIFTHQAEISYNLESISLILGDYNHQRFAWAKFLVGMKDTPESNEKPLAPKRKPFVGILVDAKRPPWKPAGKNLFSKASLSRKDTL